MQLRNIFPCDVNYIKRTCKIQYDDSGPYIGVRLYCLDNDDLKSLYVSSVLAGLFPFNYFCM